MNETSIRTTIFKVMDTFLLPMMRRVLATPDPDYTFSDKCLYDGSGNLIRCYSVFDWSLISKDKRLL